MPIGYLGRRLMEEVPAAVGDMTVYLCYCGAQFLYVPAFGKRFVVCRLSILVATDEVRLDSVRELSLRLSEPLFRFLKEVLHVGVRSV